MESAAFKKLTEQLTEIVQYVRLAKMAFQENLTGKGLKPMLTNDDAAKMLGVSSGFVLAIFMANAGGAEPD